MEVGERGGGRLGRIGGRGCGVCVCVCGSGRFFARSSALLRGGRTDPDGLRLRGRCGLRAPVRGAARLRMRERGGRARGEEQGRTSIDPAIPVASLVVAQRGLRHFRGLHVRNLFLATVEEPSDWRFRLASGASWGEPVPPACRSSPASAPPPPHSSAALATPLRLVAPSRRWRPHL